LRPIARQFIEKAHDLFAKPLTLWRIMRLRDQQKWTPVLRPIARQFIEKAHDLFAKPLTLWRIMRSRDQLRSP
jgi:hypothetical protein